LASANLWDDDSWHILAAQYLEIVRKAGALSELPLALNSHVYVDLFAGELAAAASKVQELEMFAAMGFEAFADRAARELLATGEHARKRNVETLTQLTAQEAQIARFAREGLSNSEIGGRLFVSPRIVEYHLHNVFTKLDISSRAQLRSVFPADTREWQPV
jgi:DNA-binding NarL/FixJ family response regulator